jgi:hypothetical protein
VQHRLPRAPDLQQPEVLVVFVAVSEVLKPNALDRDACPAADAIWRAGIQHVIIAIASVKPRALPEGAGRVQIEPDGCKIGSRRASLSVERGVCVSCARAVPLT